MNEDHILTHNQILEAEVNSLITRVQDGTSQEELLTHLAELLEIVFSQRRALILKNELTPTPIPIKPKVDKKQSQEVQEQSSSPKKTDSNFKDNEVRREDEVKCLKKQVKELKEQLNSEKSILNESNIALYGVVQQLMTDNKELILNLENSQKMNNKLENTNELLALRYNVMEGKYMRLANESFYKEKYS